MKYNPFAYLRSEKDILKLVQTIIANTKGDGEKSEKDFWVNGEKLYYQALIGYIYYKTPKEEKNFNTLLAMIDASEVREDDEYGGRLPIHVRCLLDEFAKIGLIPRFEKLIATIRSSEISASIILQAKSQLKAIYKDNADTIIGNCDSELFLGRKEGTTLKELSENLGKETIDLYNTSETRSNQKSFGLNYQKTGKELMSRDEIKVMEGGKCIFQLRGLRPFYSDKFDITKHRNYGLLEDYDKMNLFDIEKYLDRKGKVIFSKRSKILNIITQ